MIGNAFCHAISDLRSASARSESLVFLAAAGIFGYCAKAAGAIATQGARASKASFGIIEGGVR